MGHPLLSLCHNLYYYHGTPYIYTTLPHKVFSRWDFGQFLAECDLRTLRVTSITYVSTLEMNIDLRNDDVKSIWNRFQKICANS